MRTGVSELSGAALDFAVSEAVGVAVIRRSGGMIGDGEIVLMGVQANKPWSPSTDWSQGGPLIEQFHIEFTLERVGVVFAELCNEDGSYLEPFTGEYGSTHLIAACRTIVAAKIGDEIEIPQELAS